MDLSRGYTNVMFATSLLSALGSLTVVASIIVFSKELKDKSATWAVFYIFVSNVLTSFGSLVGEPYNNSFACWYEGIVTNIFTLSSILWTVVVTLMLYTILAWKRPMQIYPATHLYCWGFPVAATLLPFINSTYGPPGGLGWCWVVTPDDAPAWVPQLWFWYSFYAWIWLAFFLIIAISLLTVITLRRRNTTDSTNKKFWEAFHKLSGYPVIIVIAWAGSTVDDFYVATYPSIVIPVWVTTTTAGLDCSLGLMSTIFFWYQDDIFRRKWGKLYNAGFSLTRYEAIHRERRRMGQSSAGGGGLTSLLPPSTAPGRGPSNRGGRSGKHNSAVSPGPGLLGEVNSDRSVNSNSISHRQPMFG